MSKKGTEVLESLQEQFKNMSPVDYSTLLASLYPAYSTANQSKSDKDPGSEFLQHCIDKAEKMTPEEYNIWYESVKDMIYEGTDSMKRYLDNYLPAIELVNIDVVFNIYSTLDITEKTIFILSLNKDFAAKLIKRDTQENHASICYEIMKHNNLSVKQKFEVCKKVVIMLDSFDYDTTGGINKAIEILEKAIGHQAAVDTIEKVTKSTQLVPFAFVNTCSNDKILNIIQNEHPQTIALILAYLDSNKSKEILIGILHQIRADVIRRISNITAPSIERIVDIERILERKLSTLQNDDFTRINGINKSVEILDGIDRGIEKEIMEGLEEEDPELAEQLKFKMFVFEDIVLLSNVDVKKLINKINDAHYELNHMATLATAMYGVDKQVNSKILKNLSFLQKKKLNEKTSQLEKPVDLKDIEFSQNIIVSIIKELKLEKESSSKVLIS